MFILKLERKITITRVIIIINKIITLMRTMIIKMKMKNNESKMIIIAVIIIIDFRESIQILSENDNTRAVPSPHELEQLPIGDHSVHAEAAPAMHDCVMFVA